MKPTNGRADGLSETAIVAAARAIIRTSGVAGLSMRRLSDDLGVALGATYHHVPNRKALLALVAHTIYADVELPDPSVTLWSDQIHVVLSSFAREVTKYPGMAAEMLSDLEGMAPVAIIEQVLVSLTSAGFTGPQVDQARAALFFYVCGLTFAGVTGGRGAAAVTERALAHFEAGLRTLLNGIALELDDASAAASRNDGRATRTRRRKL